MSEVCPNAKKIYSKNGGKTMAPKYKCDVVCSICYGGVQVVDCPDCDGCGLRTGGVACDTCRCSGKVPSAGAVAV